MIEQTHECSHCTYGYRKMAQSAGHKIGRDYVKRLMRANGIHDTKQRSKRCRTTP